MLCMLKKERIPWNVGVSELTYDIVPTLTKAWCQRQIVGRC